MDLICRNGAFIRKVINHFLPLSKIITSSFTIGIFCKICNLLQCFRLHYNTHHPLWKQISLSSTSSLSSSIFTDVYLCTAIKKLQAPIFNELGIFIRGLEHQTRLNTNFLPEAAWTKYTFSSSQTKRLLWNVYSHDSSEVTTSILTSHLPEREQQFKCKSHPENVHLHVSQLCILNLLTAKFYFCFTFSHEQFCQQSGFTVRPTRG
jgi:hypothetical protein